MLAKIFSLIWALIVGGISFFIGLQGLEAAPLKGLGTPAAEVRFAPEEILVKFKGIKTQPGLGPSAEREVMESLSAEAQLALSGIGGHVKEVYPWIGVLRVQIPSRLPVGKYIEALYRSGTVDYAEPNYQITIDAVPNDPKFNEQWGLENTGQSGGTPDADIDAPAAWNIQKGGAGVVVALIDTGVDYNHEDLAVNMWKNPDEIAGNGIDDDGNGFVDDIYGIDRYYNDVDPMDENGHGTHLAGIIAAKGNNGKGISGVAWTGKIMALKFSSYENFAYVSQAIGCINYALAIQQREGYRMVMNTSWETPYFSQSLEDAFAAAKDKGVLMVASASRYDCDQDLYPVYPACFDLSNIISVGRSDRNDQPHSDGYGSSTVDFHAPGTDISSTLPSNAYGIKSGSSMACAHVSGAAAVIWSKQPAYGWRKVKALILNGAEDGIAGAFPGKNLTEGRLNLSRSLSSGILGDPAIFSVMPNKAWVGETITIEGINFGSTGTVKFKTVALSSGSITSWSDTKIVVTLPSGLPQGEGRLQVSTASGTSRGAYFAHGKVAALVGHVLLPRYGATSAQVGTDVWIFGGFTNWGQTGLVERYNLASNYSVMDSRWMMPTVVYAAGAAAIGSKIYVVGGYDGDIGQYYATLQIFDTVTRTWTSGADAPVVFNGPGVVSYGGKLYVFGGAYGGPNNPPYVYDPGSNTWTSLSLMPTAACFAAAAPIGTTGKILVMGGYSSSWVEQASTQEYDIAANSWTPRSNMKRPRARAAGINNGNKVFCLHGAAKDNDYLADGEWYGSGIWRDTIFGSQELFTALAGRYHDKIFTLTGQDQEKYSSNVWRFISP